MSAHTRRFRVSYAVCGLALAGSLFAGLVGPAQAGSSAYSWAGTWRISSPNWGDWTLSQSGASVKGTYPFCDGRVSGTATGLELAGTWRQSWPCGGAVQASGRFEITMSADGNSFAGHWRYASTGGWRENDPVGTRVPPLPSRVAATYKQLKGFMAQFDKGAFSRVTDVGALARYRATLAGLTISVDPKQKPLAKYDPNTNTITFSRDPTRLKTVDLSFGETVWHELTHAIEDAHGDIGAFDSPLYAERNIEYMTYVTSNALATLERMEKQAKAGASPKQLRLYWSKYVKDMARATRLPETRKYPPDRTLLKKWFGFSVDQVAVKKLYLSGKAFPGKAGLNLRKALLGA